MKGQRREQAQGCFRHALGCFSIGVAHCDLRTRQGIDSSSCPIEFALLIKTQEVLAWHTNGFDVARPYDSVLAYIL
jgi:hypothetical protein